MDQRRKDILFSSLVMLVTLLISSNAALGKMVFGVQHRYGGRRNSPPRLLKSHDVKRHGRALVAFDLPLGGDDEVTHAALYYTKLAIGSPPNEYFVQLDTGSDILWVNCVGCDKCPKKSSLGLDLKLYDPTESTTGKQVTCDENFCGAVYEGNVQGCEKGQPCTYSITYADGSGSQGYFVTDNMNFDQVTGNLQTRLMNTTSLSFGCSFGHSGTKETSTDRVSGIIGFGQSNSSIISQLALQGKTKRVFSHCLDGENGGGIFAIGQVIETKIQTTPLLSDHTHYTVKMKEIEVDGETLKVPTESFFDFGRKTVIDSGATLAHLPNSVFDLLMGRILAKQPNLVIYTFSQFNCFHYKGNVDDGFPNITFRFKGMVPMKVYPHQYLLQIDDIDQWCIGWQRGGMKNDEGDEMILLGDIVLSNKLVVYDLENQTIGWMDYNCSSSIKVKDQGSGNVYSVDAHDISPTSTATTTVTSVKGGSFSTLLLLLLYYLCFCN